MVDGSGALDLDAARASRSRSVIDTALIAHSLLKAMEKADLLAPKLNGASGGDRISREP
jgi:hypothetical protein